MSGTLEGLRSLLASLEGGALPPAEAFTAAGELGRREGALGIPPGPVDAALRRLDAAAARAAVGALPVAELEGALVRAADEAVETALAEDADERGLWASAALDGLRARDRAESVRFALRRWEGLLGPLEGTAGDAGRALEEALQRVDRTLRGKARWFTGINPHRRAERDLLDAGPREAAWWFASRAECDDLLPQLSGQVPRQGPHLEQCLECQRDLERSQPVETPPAPHLSADDAWRYDFEQMSPAERARAEEHASACDGCAQLLDALAAGDEAIAELEREQMPPSGPSATTGLSSTRRPGRHLVAAQTEFRLVLVRDPGRVRLIVKPLSGRGLAAAAVSLPPYRTALPPRQTAEGYEFDLGSGEELVGQSARVRVRLPDGSPFERDVEL